jgi:hypothetical protein
MRLHRLLTVISLLSFVVLPYRASADTLRLSYTGAFTEDDSVQTFTFSLATDTEVYVQSLAYGGGTNIMSDAITSGGFASALWLFDGGGNLIADDSLGGTVGSCGNRTGDPTTFPAGACLDAYIPDSGSGWVDLTPGSYTVALTQQGNDLLGTTLASGFSEVGNPDYTGGPFIDPFGNQRDGDWAVDIVGNTITIAPEPATIPMVLLSLAGFACFLIVKGAH